MATFAPPRPPKTDPDNPVERAAQKDFDLWEREMAATQGSGRQQQSKRVEESGDEGTVQERTTEQDENEDRQADQADQDSQDLAEREQSPGWDTNLDDRSSSPISGKLFGKNLSKKAAQRWAMSLIISAVVGIFGGGIAALSLQLAHFNERFGTHSFRFLRKSMRSSMAVYRHTTYFANPDNCTGSKTKCKYHKGLTQAQIDALERAGLQPDVATSTSGKKYIRSFTITGTDGKPVRVTSDTFMDHYFDNPRLITALDDVAKTFSILTMGKQTLRKVLLKFRINVTNPAGDAPTPAKADEEFRRTTRVPDEAPYITGIPEIDDELRNNATKTQIDYTKPGTAFGVLSNDLQLDAPGAASVINAAGNGAIGGMGKRMGQGALGTADTVCSTYNVIRASAVMAKIYLHRALIKYAYFFLTLGSKLKAGALKPYEISMAMGMALRPSILPESRGKNFAQSASAGIILDGKIRPNSGMARWTKGGSFIGALGTTRAAIESLARKVGLNARRDCGAVKSTIGQVLLTIGGIVLTGATLGAGFFVGVVGMAAVGATAGVIFKYMIPRLEAYLTGQVTPDTNDPEGGYGMGNAMAAGVQGVATEVGKANGLRPMESKEYGPALTAAIMEDNKLAAIERAGKNPFSFDDPYSITSQFALVAASFASSPTVAAQGAIMSTLTPFAALHNTLLPSIMSSPVLAVGEDPYGIAVCQDEDILEMGLATDAFCNELYFEKDSVLLDPKYAPDPTNLYMTDNGHVHPETGEPASDAFKNFTADCIDDETPLLSDGGGGSIGETVNSAGGQINTAQCRSQGEIYNYFRAYIRYGAIDEGEQQGLDRSFGKETEL